MHSTRHDVQRCCLLTMLCLAASASGPVAQAGRPDNQPVEPFRIADNLFYVGTSDIASYLITTPEGHLLIDAGYDDTPPLISRSVATLGFRVEDIRILLNTQAHLDHAGGFAEMKRKTGASLMVAGDDATLVEAGGHDDFRFGNTLTFPPAHVDRRLRDGDEVTLGGVTLTAHLTPGHTKGCTTWTLDARDHGTPYHVVVLGGATINPGVRVSGMPAYPTIADDYRKTFRVLRALPVDIFLGAHASYFGGMDKAGRLRARPGGPNPFVDRDGYLAYVAARERGFLDQLAREQSQAPGVE